MGKIDRSLMLGGIVTCPVGSEGNWGGLQVSVGRTGVQPHGQHAQADSGR
jgi:hypothetical protein